MSTVVEEEESSFLGIVGSKQAQIQKKNSHADTSGIWSQLPAWMRASLSDPQKSKFVSWIDHGVTRGKAAIVQLFTPEESDAIIQCMMTDSSRAGVLSASQVAELYVGRVNTSRHLITDRTLADCLLQRFRHCPLEGVASSAESSSFLFAMQFGKDVVAVGEKIRLVTTEEGGGHQKHADISEPSDDGRRISKLTFQCYLNPEAYDGGNFQLYPPSSPDKPIEIVVEKGSAIVFVQEDQELLHGGARKGPGQAKRAIRGNLEIMV